MKKGKYHWLDALRFLAAFTVVLSHTSIEFQSNFSGLQSHDAKSAVLYLLLRSGSEAVVAFFVLSGFLVGGRTLEKLQDGVFCPKQYLIDRMVRILLPLVPALLLSYAVNTLIGEHHSIYAYLGNLFSLQGALVEPVNGVLWSLSNEVWFYALMFGIALLAFDGTKKLIGGGIFILSLSVTLELGAKYLFVWIIGAVAFLLRKIIVTKRRTIFVVLMMVVASFYYKQTSWSGGLLLPSIPTPSREVILLAYAALMGYIICWLSQATPKSSFSVKLEMIGTVLARFSYTLYLCHYPILLFFKNYVLDFKSHTMDSRSIISFVLIAIAATICCWPLYWLFERNTAKIKQIVSTKILK